MPQSPAGWDGVCFPCLHMYLQAQCQSFNEREKVAWGQDASDKLVSGAVAEDVAVGKQCCPQGCNVLLLLDTRGWLAVRQGQCLAGTTIFSAAALLSCTGPYCPLRVLACVVMLVHCLLQTTNLAGQGPAAAVLPISCRL